MNQSEFNLLKGELTEYEKAIVIEAAEEYLQARMRHNEIIERLKSQTSLPLVLRSENLDEPLYQERLENAIREAATRLRENDAAGALRVLEAAMNP